MKVLAVTPNYPPRSRVGAWVTSHEYLTALPARGHSVTVASIYATEDPYTHDGIRVETMGCATGEVPHLASLADRVDVIVSHTGDGDYAHKVARCLGVPSVRLSHAPGRATEDDCGDLVIAVSQHTADAVHSSVPTIVCPPPIDPDAYRTTPGDAVTLINLSELKGGPLFWSLTEAMGDVEFLAVMGGYGRQEMPPEAHAAVILGWEQATHNTAILPSQIDVRTVYSRTRVLLMPSERESYGRVAVEAACSGIPTIAHPTPGLVEALGDAGIWCDRNDQGAWETEIRRLQDPAEWAAASAKAQTLADSLDPQAILDRFCTAVEQTAPVAA